MDVKYFFLLVYMAADLAADLDKLLAALGGAWLVLTLLRRATASREAAAVADGSAAPSDTAEALRRLQWQYLPAWLLFKAADWMQGPYFHEVYASKRHVATGEPFSDTDVRLCPS